MASAKSTKGLYLNPGQEVRVFVRRIGADENETHRAIVTSRKPVRVARENTVRVRIDGFSRSTVEDSQSVYVATFPGTKLYGQPLSMNYEYPDIRPLFGDSTVP